MGGEGESAACAGGLGFGDEGGDGGESGVDGQDLGAGGGADEASDRVVCGLC